VRKVGELKIGIWSRDEMGVSHYLDWVVVVVVVDAGRTLEMAGRAAWEVAEWAV
jgi:hypothetical protein